MRESVRPKLSVIIPVYNEARWIAEIIRRVKAVPIPKEIIVVDDGSTDGTRDILSGLIDEEVRVYFQPANQGKGAALREGFRRARGDIIVIQDADLEYDPADYQRLMQPIIDGRVDVVYGSRFHDGKSSMLHAGHYLGNRLLTMLSNLFTHLRLTDMETCYKVFRREVLEGITLRSNRFGFEPEITAKIAKKRNPRWRVGEVPIRYAGRTYAEGKKIRAWDALTAVWCVVRYGLWD